MSSDKLRGEIVLVLSALMTVINVVQLAAIDLPTWAHQVILIVTALATAFGVRQNVSPVPKSDAAP
jgi:hypothetical protein